MSSFHVVEPEVAGGWGENTEFTRTPGKPVTVHKLHYRFDGWLGDALLESTPCYIATERLTAEIEKARLTGMSLDGVETSKSEQFGKLYPDQKLPKFIWLKIKGTPGQDDFGVTSDLRLVVSEQALLVLQKAGISNASIGPFEDLYDTTA